jgi:hypothetical protein
LRKNIIRVEIFANVFGVEGDFVSIHAHHRHFDWSSKVKVVVGQMIGACLKLLFGESGCIIYNLVKNWLSGGHCSFV